MSAAGWLVPALVAMAMLGGYAVALRCRRRTLPAWRPARTVAWVGGVALVAVALSPPLMAAAHHDHRVHMAQHLLLGMYAPLALVLGTPVTLLFGALSRPSQLRFSRFHRSAFVRVVSHPVTAALLNVGGMVLLYLSPLYALSMASPLVNALVLTHFVAAGYLYAWSIAGPDPAPHRPGMVTRLAVLVVAAGVHAWLAKFLFSRAHLFGGHHGGSTTMEQAAQVMYYGGDGSELLLAVMLFAWWYRSRAPLRRAAAVPA